MSEAALGFSDGPGERAGQATFTTTTPEQTRALGRVMATALRPGDVVVLTGELGTGKPQLTKGIAEGLGVEGEVTSPTFALEIVHEGGSVPLYHFDLYRLDDPSQLGDAGVWDALGADGVCVLEWGERFVDELGDERVDVTIKRLEGAAGGRISAGEQPRRIELVAHEARGIKLVADVVAAASKL